MPFDLTQLCMGFAFATSFSLWMVSTEYSSCLTYLSSQRHTVINYFIYLFVLAMPWRSGKWIVPTPLLLSACGEYAQKVDKDRCST
jgi:hypothetical protein